MALERREFHHSCENFNVRSFRGCEKYVFEGTANHGNVRGRNIPTNREKGKNVRRSWLATVRKHWRQFTSNCDNLQAIATVCEHLWLFMRVCDSSWAFVTVQERLWLWRCILIAFCLYFYYFFFIFLSFAMIWICFQAVVAYQKNFMGFLDFLLVKEIERLEKKNWEIPQKCI